MDAKARITLGLLAGAALAGTALGLGAGRPPSPTNPGVAAIRAEIEKSARAAGGLSGRDLFVERRCVTCHGTDGTGGAMGPALGVVMPEYLSAAGGDEREAKRRLVEYLREPQKVPVLRKGTMRYPNPMPSAKGLGLSEEELERVADFVLHLKPPSVSTGGDGGGGK